MIDPLLSHVLITVVEQVLGGSAAGIFSSTPPEFATWFRTVHANETPQRAGRCTTSRTIESVSLVSLCGLRFTRTTQIKNVRLKRHRLLPHFGRCQCAGIVSGASWLFRPRISAIIWISFSAWAKFISSEFHEEFRETRRYPRAKFLGPTKTCLSTSIMKQICFNYVDCLKARKSSITRSRSLCRIFIGYSCLASLRDPL